MKRKIIAAFTLLLIVSTVTAQPPLPGEDSGDSTTQDSEEGPPMPGDSNNNNESPDSENTKSSDSENSNRTVKKEEKSEDNDRLSFVEALMQVLAMI